VRIVIWTVKTAFASSIARTLAGAFPHDIDAILNDLQQGPAYIIPPNYGSTTSRRERSFRANMLAAGVIVISNRRSTLSLLSDALMIRLKLALMAASG
jgi:hypothetical protein